MVATTLATRRARENGRMHTNIKDGNINGKTIKRLKLSVEVLFRVTNIVPNMPMNITPKRQKNNTIISRVTEKSNANA